MVERQQRARKSRDRPWTRARLAPAGLLGSLALLLLAGPALAGPLIMIPDPVSTGIHSPLASITATLAGSRTQGQLWLEYEVDAFFIDTCCDYLLDIAYPSAIVTGVDTELLASPAGGAVSWFNTSATPVDLATISMNCTTTPSDNLCRYRVRLEVSELPTSGSIQLIPVTYQELPAVPALGPGGQLLAVISMLVAGALAARRESLARPRGARPV